MRMSAMQEKKAFEKNQCRLKLRDGFEREFTAILIKKGSLGNVQNVPTLLQYAFPVVEKYKKKGITYGEILDVVEDVCGVLATENSIALAYRRLRDRKKYGSH